MEYGEVFTPIRIVKFMLDQDGIYEAVNDLTKRFLEPSAGEGVFLVEILKRRLKIVKSKFNDTLNQYENYALLALSSIYGVELLEDNTQACVMNLYESFSEEYKKIAKSYDKSPKPSVLKSARVIISANIEQGNFLTRKKPDGTPLYFSEWKPLNIRSSTQTIIIIRTHYSLDDIYSNVIRPDGNHLCFEAATKGHQISIDEWLGIDGEQIEESKIFRFAECPIKSVYLEKLKEI